MRVKKFNLKEDIGKEFSIKLLPNIENLANSCKHILKYFEGNQEISKNDYFNALRNGKCVMKLEKFAFYALVNGEYCIVPLSKVLDKFRKFALDGAYYKLKSEITDTTPSLYSLDEFEEFKVSVYYSRLKKENKLHLLEKIVISKEPINILDIKNDWSLKFTIENKMGFISYENIRLERDEKNLIWDGNKDNMHEVQRFLNDKDLILDEYAV